MIPLRYLLPWIALAIAACVAPQPPRESAAPAASVETVRMRSLRSDTPCPPEFSGTCYPVWFGTNRKPRDAADLTKGFGGDFDDQIYFGKNSNGMQRKMPAHTSTVFSERRLKRSKMRPSAA